MATPTYTAIASITLGSSASSVEFSSIPQDYRDLMLVMQTDNNDNGDLSMTLNGDTTNSNYSYVTARGDGTSAVSNSGSTRLAGSIRTGIGITTVQLMDYSATDKHKTSLIRNSYATGSPGRVLMVASRYASTTAITSVKFEIDFGGPFESGSTFALYGIAS